jgi:regulator of sirC expression with transglutaminase-like and TPR domain
LQLIILPNQFQKLNRVLLILLSTIAFHLSAQPAEQWVSRGLVLDSAGNYSEAVKCYNKALEFRPDAAVIWYNRGVCYMQLKKYGLAVVDFNKALYLDSSLVDAYFNRSLAYRYTGNYQFALSDISTYISQFPEDFNAIESRALLAIEMKDYQTAATDLELLLASFTSNTEYALLLEDVYIQSKQLSQWRYNCLMIPSLLITCGVTIFSDLVKCDGDNKWIITALNASIGLLIAMMNFLKLESSTTMFLQLANHYDKLEVSIEMTNSKLVLMDTENERRTLVLNQIKLIEEKMNEMKEVNNVLIPTEMNQIFPIICHVNIFSFIKKLENHRQILVLKFKDIQNEIRFILHKWEKEEQEVDINTMNVTALQRKTREKQREQNRLNFLYTIKDKLKIELNDCKAAYGSMDDIFTTEIKQAERETSRLGIWFVCLWRQCFTPKRMKNVNPILDKYFHFLFTDE